MSKERRREAWEATEHDYQLTRWVRRRKVWVLAALSQGISPDAISKKMPIPAESKARYSKVLSAARSAAGRGLLRPSKDSTRNDLKPARSTNDVTVDLVPFYRWLLTSPVDELKPQKAFSDMVFGLELDEDAPGEDTSSANSTASRDPREITTLMRLTLGLLAHHHELQIKQLDGGARWDVTLRRGDWKLVEEKLAPPFPRAGGIDHEAAKAAVKAAIEMAGVSTVEGWLKTRRPVKT